MPRHLIHRDELLFRTGAMPVRKEGETDKQFECRKSERANRRANDWDLKRYRVDGTNAIQYDADEVERKKKDRVHEIPAAA